MNYLRTLLALPVLPVLLLLNIENRVVRRIARRRVRL
jgi:hypothetical protein